VALNGKGLNVSTVRLATNHFGANQNKVGSAADNVREQIGVKRRSKPKHHVKLGGVNILLIQLTVQEKIGCRESTGSK
jgi:hypothetical protein